MAPTVTDSAQIPVVTQTTVFTEQHRNLSIGDIREQVAEFYQVSLAECVTETASDEPYYVAVVNYLVYELIHKSWRTVRVSRGPISDEARAQLEAGRLSILRQMGKNQLIRKDMETLLSNLRTFEGAPRLR